MATSMPWTVYWNEISPFQGYCNDLISVNNVKKAFEVYASTTFVSGKQEKDFGKDITIFKQSRIRFQDIGGMIPFDGTPFVVIATSTKECMFGRDKHRKKKNDKIMERESELESDHPRPKRHRDSLQTTRKKGCVAKIVIKEVLRLTEFKLLEDKADLYGAIMHRGTKINRGHFFAIVRHMMQWYKVDDMKITRMTRDVALKEMEDSYILFYRTRPRPYIN